jgi:hypothetical protein
MTHEARASSEVAVWAFAAVALATVLLCVFALRSAPFASVGVTAVSLGTVAGISGFLAASTLLRLRSRSMSPQVGTRGGTGLGVLLLTVAALVHALLTSGSAGVVYSLIGQSGYTLLVLGVPFAVAGAVLGRSIDRRILSSPATAYEVRGPSGGA